MTVAKPRRRGGLGGWLRRLRRWVLGIPASAMCFERRGFRDTVPGMRKRIEEIGAAFAEGYHAALEARDHDDLRLALSGVAVELQGFAFEGAGMGLAILDFLPGPGRHDRVLRFLAGAGDAHAYVVHVGAGWAMARVQGNLEKRLARFDPLLRWLMLDGWGFHQAFFNASRYAAGESPPATWPPYARRAFDQGLGRCLWFIEGGDVRNLPSTLLRFAQHRHADLWSGVGLACAYAGVIEDASALGRLRDAAGPHVAALGQGAAFAAKARLRAGHLPSHTEVVCRWLCGLPAAEAAALTDLALENLPMDGDEPAYEAWRARVQARLPVERISAP